MESAKSFGFLTAAGSCFANARHYTDFAQSVEEFGLGVVS